MTDRTSTPPELFVVAVQDLYDAEQGWIERLPALEGKAGRETAAWIVTERARAKVQADRLQQLARCRGADPVGAPNIWLRAILDDADRDARTIIPGPLRDIALVGAFRKGKQSERVSYETAIGLAETIDDQHAAKLLRVSCDEEASADALLAQLLTTLLR